MALSNYKLDRGPDLPPRSYFGVFRLWGML
jgi:hypothetical protein